MQSSDELNVFLYQVLDSQSKLVDWGDYRIGYFLAKNKNKSTGNEDALFIASEKDNLIFGVSDGAGGHPKGSEAAYLTGNLVMKAFQNKTDKELNIINLIEKINDEILDMKVGAHCTLSLATISKDHLRSFSVGDSEIIYWNSFATEIYSNIPHSEVGYQIEAGVIEQEESLDAPDRYMVNNMLGDTSIRIEVASKMLIKKGHTLLIGSDGLFDNLSHEQLNLIVGKGVFEKSFEELVEICKKQNEETWKKDDDISFIMLRKIKA